MSSYHDDFPSKYLKASDITAPYDATIIDVIKENVGTGEKPELKLVALFREDSAKPVVLNRTRCESLEEITGTDEKTQWVGKRVHVAQGQTRFGGKKVACVVLSAPDLPF
jgi:hypothetical protein